MQLGHILGIEDIIHYAVVGVSRIHGDGRQIFILGEYTVGDLVNGLGNGYAAHEGIVDKRTGTNGTHGESCDGLGDHHILRRFGIVLIGIPGDLCLAVIDLVLQMLGSAADRTDPVSIELVRRIFGGFCGEAAAADRAGEDAAHTAGGDAQLIAGAAGVTGDFLQDPVFACKIDSVPLIVGATEQDVLQIPGTLESTPFHIGQGGGQDYGLQIVAVVEGALVNIGDTLGDSDALQILAISEGVAADVGDRIGDLDGF